MNQNSTEITTTKIAESIGIDRLSGVKSIFIFSASEELCSDDCQLTQNLIKDQSLKIVGYWMLFINLSTAEDSWILAGTLFAELFIALVIQKQILEGHYRTEVKNLVPVLERQKDGSGLPGNARVVPEH